MIIYEENKEIKRDEVRNEGWAEITKCLKMKRVKRRSKTKNMKTKVSWKKICEIQNGKEIVKYVGEDNRRGKKYADRRIET